jgi:hypothetical protein
MLFEEHHRQLANKRQKIHSMTERTLAIFLIVAGWLIFTREPLASGVRWVITGLVIVLTCWACKSIYNNNRAWQEVADVVRHINEAFGLHEPGKFIKGKPLYPVEWKGLRKSGTVGEFKKAFFRILKLQKLEGSVFHIFAILAGALLCVFAAIIRP